VHDLVFVDVIVGTQMIVITPQRFMC